eukprot:TRINITY_DN9032_c0_g1_i1.p1 TRINITY_DN9032_c0_g1~~TRINITY_DN9032_c0_g1_i1.p1  ORF type:complete len:534 (+),score=103.96 TRINITY_DN9032_c0_g1_i1:494-2095(+)
MIPALGRTTPVRFSRLALYGIGTYTRTFRLVPFTTAPGRHQAHVHVRHRPTTDSTHIGRQLHCSNHCVERMSTDAMDTDTTPGQNRMCYVPSLKQAVHVLDGTDHDFDPILKMLTDKTRIVLIGEASHGTHDFYRLRAQLSKRLICEHGFNAVVCEADWPDMFQVNRYVRGWKGVERAGSATEALNGFERFPQWMWRNADVLDFVGWLRGHNDKLHDRKATVGMYGMDMYSMFQSMEEVLKYLQKTDTAAMARAKHRYACFDHCSQDPQVYGMRSSFLGACEAEACEQLREMLTLKPHARGGKDPLTADDERFYAEQNARVVANAEKYYRAMFRGHVKSWNQRDTHMVDTLQYLMAHLDKSVSGGRSKIIVWAHNSHLGDARATEVGDRGEINVGQLCRQRWPNQSLSVGFTTFTGTVSAAHEWDEPVKRKTVRPGLSGSWESLFHATGVPKFLLNIRDAQGDALAELQKPRLQRAIGVIYRPDTERQSHYYHVNLAKQFDALIHLDVTRAVEPLERKPHQHATEPEAFPTGL